MLAAQHSDTAHCFMHNASEIGIKLKFKWAESGEDVEPCNQLFHQDG